MDDNSLHQIPEFFFGDNPCEQRLTGTWVPILHDVLYNFLEKEDRRAWWHTLEEQNFPKVRSAKSLVHDLWPH